MNVYSAKIEKRDCNPFYEVHIYRHWTTAELAVRGRGKCRPSEVIEVGVLTGFPRKDAEHLVAFIQGQGHGKDTEVNERKSESESDGTAF